LRNPELDIYELNFAVQHTIDRIIFLRICEDRGIEGYGRLQGLINGANGYERLLHLFTQADKKYNSGLFDFKADRLSHNLKIDDKVLKEIIENLYYPKSPYEFSVLGADILGNVYEQFLGKVIRLTAGHQAKVEEKPEVKKAGGVYYTPQYIAEYIVKNTVGRLLGDTVVGSVGAALRGRPDLKPAQPGQPHRVAPTNITPKEVSKIRILDPACGSGSFLIGAYQYLLDWHLKWYRDNDPEKHAKGKTPAIYLGAGKEWRLTTQEKKRILLNNIYGVDIDRRAVEVTKLSLLLKLLENENEETVGKTMALFQERVLPSLENNIKCGNSLIGPDFYNSPFPLFSKEGVPKAGAFDDDIRRINVFDWEKEFSETMKTGGFDAVIGNPPYGAQLFQGEINYLRNKYQTAEYQLDTYPLFIEKAFLLGKQDSYLGMIIPSAWVASHYNKILRQLLVSKTSLQNIVIAPKNTFVNATVETLILIAEKDESRMGSFLVERWDDDKTSYHLNQSDIQKHKDYLFPVYSNPTIIKVVEKIKSCCQPLSEYATAVWGVKIYQKGKGNPPQRGDESEIKKYHSRERTKGTHRPLLGGKEVNRYLIDWDGMYVDYGDWLAEPRTSEWFIGPRILVREVTSKGIIQATIVEDDFVFSNSVDGIKLKGGKLALAFILGVVNSKLISFHHLNTSANAFKGAFPKVLIKDLLNIPIPIIDFNSPADKTLHDKMVSLVDRMLDLNKKLQTVKIAHEKELLERQIKITDDQIDRLVYELYGLTEEEIRVVES